jgi:hypothetical protein
MQEIINQVIPFANFHLALVTVAASWAPAQAGPGQDCRRLGTDFKAGKCGQLAERAGNE